MNDEDNPELVVALAVRRFRRLGIDGLEAERVGLVIPNELAALTDGELDAYIERLKGRAGQVN